MSFFTNINQPLNPVAKQSAVRRRTLAIRSQFNGNPPDRPSERPVHPPPQMQRQKRAVGGELGGGFRVEEKGPDMQKTLIYIHVENIDQSMEQIMANGGTQVMPKTKISDEHGSFALFLDPSGTCVGIWSQE